MDNRASRLLEPLLTSPKVALLSGGYCVNRLHHCRCMISIEFHFSKTTQCSRTVDGINLNIHEMNEPLKAMTLERDREVNLADYKGDVVMVINVATF